MNNDNPNYDYVSYELPVATLIVFTILLTNACGRPQPELLSRIVFNDATPFQPIAGVVDSLFSGSLPVQNEPA
jgi:hypothetical protein